MNLLRKLACAGPAAVLFLLFAAPAFAQFEVNPDHFDNQPPSTKKTTAQVTKASHPPQHASRKSADLKSQAKTNTETAKSGAGSSLDAANTGANAPRSIQTASTSAKLHTNRKTKSASPVQHVNAQASPVPRE